jgi:hypothetical protein
MDDKTDEMIVSDTLKEFKFNCETKERIRIQNKLKQLQGSFKLPEDADSLMLKLLEDVENTRYIYKGDQYDR